MMAKSKLLMGFFLFSEANFFLTLIVVYIFYNGAGGMGLGTTGGPTAAGSLKPGVAGINTLILVASSITMWLADKSLERDRRAGLRGWLLVTIILGAVFLTEQGREWTALISRNVTISRDLFGSTFFTLTGLHGFHVGIGLVALTILFGLALTGKPTPQHADAVASMALYWHFVDAVWIVIYSVIYLRTLL
jgi:heme/copper-type cytochrome/quinol oxidase subunit 3